MYCFIKKGLITKYSFHINPFWSPNNKISIFNLTDIQLGLDLEKVFMSFLTPAVSFKYLSSASSGGSSLAQNGHFISKVPTPQQSQVIIPSGVAAKCGKDEHITNPLAVIAKFVCCGEMTAQ